MDVRFEALARDEADVKAARMIIWDALEAGENHRTAYAALCRWTWRAMIERRLDDDMRSWHRLLLDTAGRLSVGAAKDARSDGRRLTRAAVAERLKGFADIVRMSIEAADATPAKDLTARAHVLEILRVLAGRQGDYLEREHIRKEIGLKDANLSRVLTLLAANGLVERQSRGKGAAFRATQRALNLVDAPNPAEKQRARAEMPPPPAPAHLPSISSDRVKLFSRAFGATLKRPHDAETYDALKIVPTNVREAAPPRVLAEA